MTTAVQTQKLIFPSTATAKMMLGKLAKKNPSVKYEIITVASGHQIVTINKLPDYMPPAIPLKPAIIAPAPKASKAKQKSNAAQMMEPTGTIPAEVAGLSAQFSYEYQKQTAQWVYYKFASGKESVIHKGKLIGWTITEDGMFVGTALISALQAAKDKWDK